jgi:hypothetical protein
MRPKSCQGCGASTCTTVFTENIDIVGTPVIDQETQRLFVVARTKENTGFVQRLHALDITTGRSEAEQPGRASVPGTGAGRHLLKWSPNP